MPSSVIAGFEYAPASRELIVRFQTGRVYVYSNVPAETAAAFRHAFSKGTFFNREIRDRFSFRELAPSADA